MSRLLLLASLMVAVLPALFIGAASEPALAQGDPDAVDVLLFTKTAAFRHGNIPAGIAAIEQLGTENGWNVVSTEDATAFTDENLADYDVVVWFSTTGDVLNDEQQAAFERYIQSGGGYAGIHAASDTEYDWPWYGELVGAYFVNHPPGTPDATIDVLDGAHPSTAHLPTEWDRTDEWYNYDQNVRGDVHVLAALDEESYSGGSMGTDHPIAWCQDYDGGRSWYTGGGHTNASFAEPEFLAHIEAGILTAAGELIADCGATVEDQFERTVIDDGTANPMKLDIAEDGRVFFVERDGRLRMWDPETEVPSTVGTIEVYEGQEDGLLGIALDPDFTTNGWIYLTYSAPGNVPCTDADPDATTCGEQQVSRFTFTEGALDLDSEAQLLEVVVQRNECCHAGGDLEFDEFGNLYMSFGDDTNPFDSGGYTPIDERDGRSSWDAQRSSGNTNDLRGKVLRITPEDDGTYSIPDGNLFDPDDTSGLTRPEIFAMGFRNPFTIEWDPTHDRILVGDYGPDANNANANRGPDGRVEWLAIPEASNQGWPYCHSDVGYNDYDFATSTSGAVFDCANPVNDSPNNTGLTDLPPAQPATLWWGRSSTGVPAIGTGGAPQAGGAYEYDAATAAPDALPEYYDGVAFLMEWNQGNIYEVHSDEAGEVTAVVPWLDGETFRRPHAMEIGPDGAIYLIEWGSGFGGDNADSGVFRIGYTGGSFRPVAVATADVTNGATPLAVQFSSDGSEALAPDATLVSTEWDFDGDGTVDSTDANPNHTYTEAGLYTAVLTVTDSLGATGVASIEITAGNTRPEVTVDMPVSGGFLDFGDTVAWGVTVTDAEDGTSGTGIACDDIDVRLLLGHDEHAHALQNTTGCAGDFHTSRDAGHGVSENLFSVIEASYADAGGDGAPTLTDNDVVVLQPKRRQAEHFGSAEGAGLVEDLEAAAGGFRVAMNPGDHFAFSPVNLTGIEALRVRYTAANAASLELRKGAPDGPLAATVDLPATGGTDTYLLSSPADVTDPGGTDTYFLVLGTGGDADIDELYFDGRGVADNAAPTVTASADPTTGNAPLQVSLTGSATDADGDEITSYEWDLGDGTTASGADVSHTYDTPGTYVARLSATDERGAIGFTDVTITVEPSIEPPACLAPGSDEFDGTSLDPGIWTEIIRGDQTGYRVENGQLVLTLSDGDLYQGTNTANNIILQPIPGGAFQATTQVTVNPTETYQQGGLILYGDDDNYIKLDLVYNGNRAVEFLQEVDGTARNTNEDNSGALPAEFPTTFLLRVNYDGTEVTASYSGDGGATFTPVGRPAPMPDNARIGLFALTGNNTAANIESAFDYFYVEEISDEPLTVSDEFDGDTLNRCRWSEIVRPDPDLWEVADGALTLTTPDGDIYQTPNTDPANLILQPMPDGNWTIETMVSAEILGRYQQAGLLAYVDDDHYVKFDLVAGAGDATGPQRFELRSESGATIQNPQPQVNSTATEFGLRLTKQGDSFIGAYSTDGGATWTEMAEAVTNTALAELEASFGLFTLGVNQGNDPRIDSVDAAFDYFRLASEQEEEDTTPPTVEVSVRGDLAGDVQPAGSTLPNADGTATLTRSDAGTEVTVDLTGFAANTTYRAHLHEGTCTEMGPHYQDDPNGPETPPNEIHLSSTANPADGLQSDASGAITGSGTATWIARAVPLSVMVHEDAAPGLPVACATLLATDAQQVVITADDGDGSGVDTIEYRIDAGDWTPYSGPITVDQAGEHTVEGRATDVAGNTSDPVGVTVVISEEDTVSPVASIELDPEPDENGEVIDGPVDVTLSATDPSATVDVIDNDFDPQTTTITAGESVLWTWTGNQEHNVQADDGSFASPTQTAGTFAHAFDTPGTYEYFCGIHSTASGTAQNGTVVVEPAAGPADELTIEYRVDDPSGDWVAYDDTFEVAGLGEHTVEARATDSAGNVSDVVSRTFTIVEEVIEDTTPPTATLGLRGDASGDISSIEGRTTLDITGTATLTRSDSGTDVTLTAAGLEPGATHPSHLHFGTCADPAGHYADDPSGPGTPPNELWMSSTADPTAGLTVAADGTVTGTGSADWIARAVDLSIMIHDDEAPGLPIACVTLDQFGPQTVVLDAEDDLSDVDSIEYRLDGGDWTVYSAPFAVDAAGDHTVEYRATDTAGNTSDVATFAFTVVLPDTDAPTTTASLSPEPDENGEVTTPVRVTLTADDGDGDGVDRIEYRVDDPSGDWVTYTDSFVVPGMGEHTVEFRAIDLAGNVEETQTVTFTRVQRTPPGQGGTPGNPGNPGNSGTNADGVEHSDYEGDDPYGFGELIAGWDMTDGGTLTVTTDETGRICLVHLDENGAATTVRCSDDEDSSFAQDEAMRQLTIPVQPGGRVMAYRVDTAALRVTDNDRIGTAIQASRSGWDSADQVVLATAGGFADALAAAPLAGHLDAPLLLSWDTELDERVLQEIERLGATGVVMLGGEAALSSGVEATLRDAGLQVSRLAGASRTETARAVAARIGGATSGLAVVASGGSFADALAIAPIAAEQGLPIYLTGGEGLDAGTLQAMQDHQVRRVLVVGGTAVVGDDVVAQLADNGIELAARLGGANRYETAATILGWAVDGGADVTEMLVATGADFPDALAAGAYGARTDRLLLLVDGGQPLDGQPAAAFLDGEGSATELLFLLGGESALPNSLQEALGAALR